MNNLCRFVVLFGVVACTTAVHAQRIPVETRVPHLVLTDGDSLLARRESQFDRVRDVKALKDGRLFVLDAKYVYVFNAQGAQILKFEGKGSFSMPPLANPVALALDDSTLTIHDIGNRRLSTFRFDGTFVSSHPMPAVDGGEVRRRMRGGVTLIETTPPVRIASEIPDAGKPLERIVSIQRGSSLTSLFKVRMDTAYFRSSREDVVGLPNQPRAQRNRVLIAQATATRFGAGGAWCVSGDSLLAHVDGYTGAIKWYAIDARGARVTDSASLARPARRVSPEDLNDEAKRLQRLATAASPRSGEPPPKNMTDPELWSAPPMWSNATKAFFASDGALWVGVNRLYFDSQDEYAVRIGDDNTWTVYPASGPAFLVTFRGLFRLTAVVGDRLYGFIDNGVTAPVIQVYTLKKP